MNPEPIASNGLEELWRRYKETGSRTLENALVERYAYLVERAVRTLAGRFGGRAEADEMRSYGYLGLLDAVRKFDPERGLKFVTYAFWRIRGAIYDGLRAGDALTRSARDQLKRYEDARARLEQSRLRRADDRDVSQMLGLTLPALAALKRSRSAAYGTPSDGEEASPFEQVPDQSAELPEDASVRTALRQALAEAIAALPEKERIVLALFYYEGLTLSEVASVLGLSPSRISQLHGQALRRLRPVLAPWWDGAPVDGPGAEGKGDKR
ncbi:MAG: FliA/WhiG family RNA polymerase sigma factor [Hydrogenibacillus schlegelii]|uniref:FliA/WhiG family RNA polymerase sigma factor n=1 Tax=Hydrogenibacillus schlegelii TaxID=1484 RepID=A0A947D227_HYDSH|nr:FliA/WhiG family RNA polymerase sigma factor [Hydrogenibacillus schlegelii]